MWQRRCADKHGFSKSTFSGIFELPKNKNLKKFNKSVGVFEGEFLSPHDVATESNSGLKLNHLSLALLVTSEFEMFAALDHQQLLLLRLNTNDNKN